MLLREKWLFLLHNSLKAIILEQISDSLCGDRFREGRVDVLSGFNSISSFARLNIQGDSPLVSSRKFCRSPSLEILLVRIDLLSIWPILDFPTPVLD